MFTLTQVQLRGNKWPRFPEEPQINGQQSLTPSLAQRNPGVLGGPARAPPLRLRQSMAEVRFSTIATHRRRCTADNAANDLAFFRRAHRQLSHSHRSFEAHYCNCIAPTNVLGLAAYSGPASAFRATRVSVSRRPTITRLNSTALYSTAFSSHFA